MYLTKNICLANSISTHAENLRIWNMYHQCILTRACSLHVVWWCMLLVPRSLVPRFCFKKLRGHEFYMKNLWTVYSLTMRIVLSFALSTLFDDVHIWVRVRQNYNNTCATSEDSGHPDRRPSMPGRLAFLSFDSLKTAEESCKQRRLRSDCADTQANPSLR